ncbi:hypothetical protein SFRURICE_017859 [Spodoptera frugiperda]|nr:hypothetical protein SFRURICE_017859 [Spodoptera frugiperda]
MAYGKTEKSGHTETALRAISKSKKSSSRADAKVARLSSAFDKLFGDKEIPRKIMRSITTGSTKRPAPPSAKHPQIFPTAEMQKELDLAYSGAMDIIVSGAMDLLGDAITALMTKLLRWWKYMKREESVMYRIEVREKSERLYLDVKWSRTFAVKRLRAQQSLTLRTIVKAPRFVRNATISRDLGVESVDDFVQRLSTNMFERAGKSRHDHLRALAPYHRRPPDGYGLPRDLVAPADPPDAAT